MPSRILKSVVAVKFQATKTYSSSELTKANDRIYETSIVEKEIVVWKINDSSFVAYERKTKLML
jgi:hypothetical protein